LMFKIVRPLVSSSRGGARSANALMSTKASPDEQLPLSGVRVHEMGQLIAGPFAGQLLGQYGAEVIKVEPPKTGDPLRVWRELDLDGTSPWFRSIARNKKSVAIDLRKVEGRDKAAGDQKRCLNRKLQARNSREMVTGAGIIASVQSFVDIHPKSGFRYVNGFPDPATGGLAGLPVRPNLSLGDSVAGLHAAFGTVIALLSRQRKA
ncbi:hypothetical protein MPER_06450, partial [Moniliophthora perniciosa FA553]